MTQVTVNAATAAQLLAILDKEVELCDSEGKVIGWYAPKRNVTMKEVIDSCPSTEEELEQQLREYDGSGRSWAEIRKDLESM